MKKILLVLMSTLLLTGCVSQKTTVTIDKDSNAVIEKKFSFGSSMTTANDLAKKAGEGFLASVRAQNPVSLLKYKTEEDAGYIAVIKPGNIADKDIFASEKFFLPKDKKNLNCKKSKNTTSCTADFVVNIASPELEKVLKDNELSYKDLDPYVLTIKLPVQAEAHNATFFDLENNVYIWEIPAGQPIPVNLKFTIK